MDKRLNRGQSRLVKQVPIRPVCLLKCVPMQVTVSDEFAKCCLLAGTATGNRDYHVQIWESNGL